MSLTRKAFLGVGATAVVAASLGGVAEALAPGDNLLRPPVVLDENELMAKCVRCYRCISVCPEGCISPATVNDGFVQIKTPKLDFHQGYCDFCNECVEVCPTDVFAEADPLNPAAGRIGFAVVIPERCLAYYEGCLVCYEACPYEAISLNEFNRPVVNLDTCNGCGVCEYVCPALVYRRFEGGTLRGIAVVPNENQAEALLAQAAAESD